MHPNKYSRVETEKEITLYLHPCIERDSNNRAMHKDCSIMYLSLSLV
jgi:hypothetical protein